MKRRLNLTLIGLAIIASNIAFAQSTPSSWDIELGSIDGLIKCYPDGGARYYLNGQNYPATCDGTSNTLVVKSWFHEDMMDTSPPLVFMKFKIDGNALEGVSVNQNNVKITGKRSGTDGKAAWKVIQAEGPSKVTPQSRIGQQKISSRPTQSHGLPQIGNSPQAGPSWPENAYSACLASANKIKREREIDDGAKAIAAFKVGCLIANRLKFSNSGNPSKLLCSAMPEFISDASKVLTEEGLSGYDGYAEQAWADWQANLGCR